MTTSPTSHPGPLLDYRVVERYLRLGNELGAYDAPAPDIREVPAPTVDRWLAMDGARVVRDAAAALTSGRAQRPDPAIHVLARAIVAGPADARAAALAAAPTALGSATHLFRFMRFIRGRTPWNGTLREAVGAWYAGRSTLELATEIVRTPAEGAWNHREAFVLARPAAPSDAHDALFRWLVEGKLGRTADDAGLDLLAAYVRLHATASPLVARSILERWLVLREALPAAWYQDEAIATWLAATASGAELVRLVGRLAAHDALGAAGGFAATARLRELAPAARAGVAPFAALAAWAQVRFLQARGQTPPPGLGEALLALFHERLAATPRGSDRLVVAVDPAASTALDGLPACPGLDPRTAIAALTMLAVATSDRTRVLAFGRDLEPLDVGAGDDLAAVLAKLDRVRAGTVDGAAPIEAAYGEDPDVAAFLVLAGTRPAARGFMPEDVLARYRRAAGTPARWIGVSLGQHRLAPRPPASHEALEIHGWDATVPAVLEGALRGARG